MKFLIDNSLSPVLATLLQQADHDAVHVRSLGLQRADDAVLFDRAAVENQTVVSADTDFGTLLAERSSQRPSVIQFRGEGSRIRTESLFTLLCFNHEHEEPEGQRGKSPKGFRVLRDLRELRGSRCHLSNAPRSKAESKKSSATTEATVEVDLREFGPRHVLGALTANDEDPLRFAGPHD